MTMRWMGRLSALLTASVLLGCQTLPGMSPVGESGALHFRFQTPALQAAPLAFSIQTVPSGTNRFSVEISGQGLSQPLTSSFDIGSGQTQSRTISGLPVGPKTVRVSALHNQDVLASGSAAVTIEAGKTAQAELELQAQSAEVTAKLETPLPLDLSLKLQITGNGITSPIERRVQFDRSQTSVSVGTLPLGAKQIQIEMIATAGDQTETASAPDASLNVTSGDNTLNISAESVIRAFADDLEALLSKADALSVLAWITELRKDPARLKRLFFMLSPETRERLRQNPAVSGLLPPESENPGAPATLASVTDVRLVLSQPLRPLLLLTSPRRDAAGETRVLEPGGTVIPDQNAWGLMVRTTFGGSAVVNYRYELRHSANNSVLASGSGTLAQRVSTDTRSASGDLIPFRGSELLVLSGEYMLSLNLSADGASESHSFPITVSA